MELRVVASGSEGNAYVLQNEGEALLLEAGVSFKKVLPALNYDVSKVQGVLISHEHGDHNAVETLPGTPAVVKTAGETVTFEEYKTPLGVESIINHVGDCFD